MGEPLDLSGSRVGRFRVEKLIGFGGMGSVYRGVDEILVRPVALKKIKTEAQFSPLHRTRFLREARILSKLDHPNICRIYDLMETRDGEFLVLEFIDGVTLRKAIKKGLSLARKLEIAEIVVRVLEKAHASDIIHRDIKPENVMLADDGTVKVLDFGLGREFGEEGYFPLDPSVRDVTDDDENFLSKGGENDSSRTTEGSIVGTLRYMSPEGARGEEVTRASDMFSFGILLQELLTETRAYGDMSQAALLMRVTLGKNRPVPDDLRIHPRLVELVEKLTSLDAAKRPTASETGNIINEIRELPIRRKRRRNWMAGVAIASVLVLASVFLTWFVTRPRPLIPPDVQRTAAILPFDNQTGDASLGWLRIGLGEFLEKPLRSVRQLSFTPAENVIKLMEFDADSAQGKMPLDELEKLRRNLGVDLLLVPWVQRQKDMFRLSVTAYDMSGSVVEHSVEHATATEGAELLGRSLAQAVMAKPTLPESVRAFSDNPFVNQAYAIGVHRINSLGAKDARVFFEVCMSLDPDFLFAQLKLAECLRKLGQLEETDQLVAEILARDLSNECEELVGGCLFLLGRLAGQKGNGLEAESLYLRASDRFRENDDKYGQANVLRQLGTLAYTQGDVPQAMQFWTESLDLFVALKDPLGEARARNNLGVGASAQGDVDLSNRYYNQALEIRKRIGDREGQADCYNNIGGNYWKWADFGTAETYFSKAEELYQKLGNPTKAAQVLQNLSECAKRVGDMAKAERTLLKSLDAQRQLNNRVREVPLLLNLSDLARMQYQLGRAEDAANEALTLAFEIDSKRDQAGAIHALSLVALDRQHLGQAVALCTEAIRLYEELEFQEKLADAINDKAEIYLEKEDWVRAEAAYFDAMKRYEEMEIPEKVALVRFNLANYYIKRGQPKLAIPYLAQAEEWFGEDFFMYLLKARYADAVGAYAEGLEWAICARSEAGLYWNEKNEQFLTKLAKLSGS